MNGRERSSALYLTIATLTTIPLDSLDAVYSFILSQKVCYPSDYRE